MSTTTIQYNIAYIKTNPRFLVQTMSNLRQFITCFIILFSGCAKQMVNCQVLSSANCDGQADVVFLIDASSSTTPTDFVSSLSYVYSMTQYLNILADHTQVGVASIIGGGRADIYLSNFTDLSLLRNAILSVPTYTTNNSPGILSASLQFVNDNMLMKNGGRNFVPKVIVIITTDVMVIKGNDANVVNVARGLQSNGVVIMMVTYGSSQDPQAVHSKVGEIVSYPTEIYTFSFTSPTFTGASYNGSVTQLCKEIPVCAGAADIAFLMDASATIMPWDWDADVSFVSSVVQNMYISQNGVRVAVLRFNQAQTLFFCLDRFTQRYAIIKEIETNVTFDQGYGKNTAQAMMYASKYIFNASCGSRLNVPHIVIVIADGRSNLQAHLTFPYATLLKNKGITVFAIGVGDIGPSGEAELKSVASLPSSTYYIKVSSFDDLHFLKNTLVMRTCRPPPANCTNYLDVVFVLDTSGSIDLVSFNNELAFIADIVGRLQIAGGFAQVGMVTFGSDVTLIFNLGSSKSSQTLVELIKNAPYNGGTTMTGDALKYVREQMFAMQGPSRNSATKIIVLLTDGVATNYTNATAEAVLTRNAGIGIISIGIGSDVNTNELQTMSSFPNDRNTIAVDDATTIAVALDPLISLLCNLVDNCQSSPCQNGGLCVNGLNSFTCKCIGSYSGIYCDQRCTHYQDVVFALDSSGSIDPTGYNQAQVFIQNVISGLNLDAGSRVGALIYSDYAEIQFNLKEYTSTSAAINAVNFRFLGNSTNTAEAIRVARSTMFTPEQGDRPNAANVLIIITDGQSNVHQDTINEAVQAFKAGITIISVGVGSYIDADELAQMASYPSAANTFTVRDYVGLLPIVTTLLNGICQVNSSCQGNPCMNGATCIDGINSFVCQCPPGFIGDTCNTNCSNMADVAFLIDASGSMQPETHKNVTDFVKGTISQMDLSSGRMRVAFIQFNDRATLLANLNNGTIYDYRQYADSIGYNTGKRNISAALELATTNVFNGAGGDRPNAMNIAVILTSGMPTGDNNLSIPMATKAHIAGITTILVTVGQGLNSGRSYIQLHSLASEPIAFNFFNVWNFTSLPRLNPLVAAAMCNQHPICLPNTCLNGGTCIEGINTFVCRCANQYSGVTCGEECGTTKLDLVLIADASGSLELGGFDTSVSIMQSLVKNLNFKMDTTRVSFLTFASDPIVVFYLKTYRGTNADLSIINAISIDSVRDGTNIFKALDFTASDVLTTANGRRPGERAAVVLLSDGKATIQPDLTLGAATNLKNSGVQIFTVALLPTADQDTMRNIASYPSFDYAYWAPTRDNVTSVVQGIISKLCQT